MPNIKVKPKGTIKKLDKNVVQLQKLKNNIVTTKEKINEISLNKTDNTAEDYASNKVQNDISYISRKGIEKGNKIGKKSLKQTQENFIKGKQKIEILKTRIKDKETNELKNIVDKSSKRIKKDTKQSIKISRNTKVLAKKEIKTTERVAKNTKQVAKESAKMIPRASIISKQVMQNIKRVTIGSTINTVKSIITGTKTLISTVVAAGWVAVVVILIIVLIGGFVAVIFNNGDTNYDISEFSNYEIVLVAKTQIGNEGGDKFWRWYGFTEHVEWCACFVSWCANECGYIDKEIIPKFSLCTDGMNWFKERNQWYDRGKNYYPIVGDIIFFDWYDENGIQDGNCDHVGIVTRTDITNRNIYTIDGNTNNKCAERMYSFDDAQVMGYGSPKYK